MLSALCALLFVLSCFVGLNAVNPGDSLFYQPIADAIDIRSMLLSDSYRFATALDYNNKYTSFMTKAFSMGLETLHQTGSIQVTRPPFTRGLVYITPPLASQSNYSLSL